MAANDVLSQDEIDALLTGVESGSVKTKDDLTAHDGVARPLDIASQDRIVRGRLPTLEMVNDRFARLLRISLFNLRRRSPEISPGEVKMFKFSEYVHSLFVPTSLNIMRVRPLRGTALLIFDPKLVFSVVNSFFGGATRFRAKIEGREFTATEQRIINMLLERVFLDLKEAWKPVLSLNFEFVTSEVNPQFANIVSPSEVVVVSTFRIEIEGDGGEVHVAMPYSMVEPIRELLNTGLQSDRDQVDERWLVALREEVKEAVVEVSSTLTETEISLRELMNLKAGDVIPIEFPNHVVLKAENLPAFRGNYGVSRGNRAIKVTGAIKRMPQQK